MLILHVWFPSDGEGGGGREGEREGGRYSVLSVFAAISCGEIVM